MVLSKALPRLTLAPISCSCVSSSFSSGLSENPESITTFCLPAALALRLLLRRAFFGSGWLG